MKNNSYALDVSSGKSLGGRSIRNYPVIITQDLSANPAARAAAIAETSSEDSGQEERAEPLKPFMPSNMARKSAFVRNADHVSQYSDKVHDRFAQMMDLLKGHKHPNSGAVSRRGSQMIDDDYLVEGRDQQYFHQRYEKIMKAPKVMGPNEVKFTPAQLRRQQVRNSKFASTNYWDRQGRPKDLELNITSQIDPQINLGNGNI